MGSIGLTFFKFPRSRVRPSILRASSWELLRFLGCGAVLVANPEPQKGLCTNIVYTWALKGFLYSSLSRAQIRTAWSLGVKPQTRA